MAILLILVAVAAVFTTADNGGLLLTAAVVVAVLSFWSNGVLANYRSNPEGAPDWAAAVSMATTAAAIALIIAGLVAD